MLRLLDIFRVMVKYRLDSYIPLTPQTKFLKQGMHLAKKFYIGRPVAGDPGYRIRCALEEMGPVYIKFGQLISSRQDLFSADIIEELTKLRDSATPFDNTLAMKIINDEVGNDIFLTIDSVPAAAASVAQVYYAQLKTGEAVAIKILRPGIEKKIKSDLELAKQLTSVLEMSWPRFKMFNLRRAIDELENSFYSELDLRLEAANAEKLRENLQDCDYVLIPKIHCVTKQVLVMERMYGTPVDKISELNVDPDTVIQQGLESLLLQIFRNGFFHADQHAGNVWIADDGKRIYLDFGIVGSLSVDDRKNLFKIVMTLFAKKYDQLAELLIELGWCSTQSDLAGLKQALQNTGNMVVGKSQKDIRTSSVLNRLFLLGDQYGLTVPAQFVLLAKTLIMLEGMSHQINPNANFEKIGQPLILKHFAKYMINTRTTKD